LHIAKKGGIYNPYRSSTIKIAKSLGISQQTISRKLKEMTDKQLIERRVDQKGHSISISEKGVSILKKIHSELELIFKHKLSSITGTLEKGFGEGRYYVSLPQYQNEFKKKLGFKAYPGTLNVKSNLSEIKIFMSNLKQLTIKGFETKNRTFGSLKCYKVKINNTKGAIVVPERTRHSENIIEIISPVYLKEKLKVNDGDKIKISAK
jgi:riboflavin kinase